MHGHGHGPVWRVMLYSKRSTFSTSTLPGVLLVTSGADQAVPENMLLYCIEHAPNPPDPDPDPMILQ